ncbi:hypothetical protein QFZ67_000631 [Streptomyces sp. V1I1]|nr:hypothetical protein [Streptomyces sp. V1I1]
MGTERAAACSSGRARQREPSCLCVRPPCRTFPPGVQRGGAHATRAHGGVRRRRERPRRHRRPLSRPGPRVYSPGLVSRSASLRAPYFSVSWRRDPDLGDALPGAARRGGCACRERQASRNGVPSRRQRRGAHACPVRNGLSLPHSSGAVEGNINRLKRGRRVDSSTAMHFEHMPELRELQPPCALGARTAARTGLSPTTAGNHHRPTIDGHRKGFRQTRKATRGSGTSPGRKEPRGCHRSPLTSSAAVRPARPGPLRRTRAGPAQPHLTPAPSARRTGTHAAPPSTARAARG